MQDSDMWGKNRDSVVNLNIPSQNLDIIDMDISRKFIAILMSTTCKHIKTMDKGLGVTLPKNNTIVKSLSRTWY